jgi:diguanylate cyclase (GGDEF)-like protein
MQWTIAFNSIFGSSLLLILIFINYIRKYNTEQYQRNIFIRLLFFTFIPMLMDFLYLAFEGIPGSTVHYLLYGIGSIYYLFQIPAYYYVFIFINYTVYKDKKRTRLITKLVWCIVVLHAIIIAANLIGHFYFYITEENFLLYGNRYYIRLIVSYLPVLFIIYDVIFPFKLFKRNQFILLLIFFFFTSISSTIDIVFKTMMLIWPCFTAALLYTYFFIIRADSKIDSLTGLGNRTSFNEFIAKLADSGGKALIRRQTGRNAKVRRSRHTQEAFSIVMIDMDHFKKINDTLGHLEGDNALRDMAAIIKSSIRQSDFAARYGGDEFVLATRVEYDVKKLMTRIQDAIEDQNRKKTRAYTLQISYGYDVYTTNSGQSMTEFLNHIDKLMYKQKTEHRRAEDRGKS